MRGMNRNNTHRNKVKWRVLTLALSIIMIQANIINVFGYEIDDLREFSGKQRINTSEYKEQQNIIINAYEEQINKKPGADELNKESIAKSIEEKRNSLNEEREKLEKSIAEDIANNVSASNIIDIIKEIENIDKKLNNTEMKIPELIVNTEELEKQYNIAKQALSIAEEKFELGEIGERTKCPVVDLFRIYYTFGDMRNPYNTDEIWHNNGVYFAIPKNGSDIRVQWNGTVKKVVRDDPTWGTYIVVQHGSSLETSYSYLDRVDVHEGQELKQYDTIGHCTNKYMYLEIILDGVYINPFRLYGSTGVNEYYSWMNSHPELVVDYEDLGNVKNYVESLVEEETKSNKQQSKVDDENTVHVQVKRSEE